MFKQGVSVAAVTGSADLTGMRYNMLCLAQQPLKANSGAEEIIHHFDGIVLELIRLFVGSTGRKPRKIVVYRDGVVDGQFAMVCARAFSSVILNKKYQSQSVYFSCKKVLQQEMMAIRKACEKACATGIYEATFEKDQEISPTYEPQITFISVQKRHKTRLGPVRPMDGVGAVRRNCLFLVN